MTKKKSVLSWFSWNDKSDEDMMYSSNTEDLKRTAEDLNTQQHDSTGYFRVRDDKKEDR